MRIRHSSLSLFFFVALASSQASSFVAPDPIFQSKSVAIMKSTRPPMIVPSARLRGGGGPVKVGGKSEDVAAKKIRIEAFDSMRLFLIINIVLGHFIKFANPSATIFKICSQHNVVVGAFFALSGYVTAYTTTELGQQKASPKLLDTPKQNWILSRVFGYFPLHLAALILFSPVFLYADVHYNGWPTALLHGIMSLTMTQAWFPQHAEIWNAPTWFLSALTFATMLMPYAIPSLASLDTAGLVKTGWWIFAVYALPKLAYAYDFNTWNVFEGVVDPRAHPNLGVFNMHRFSPVFCAAEVLLGVVACRIVMLHDRKTNALSTMVPLLGLVIAMAARSTFDVSDLLFRSLFFVPVFLRLLMATHRNTVSGVSDPVVSILSSKPLVWLGNLSFPIFIVHGPVGQIFYKKLIAKQLWGDVLTGPTNFGLYLASTIGVAWILQKVVLQSKAVSNWSKQRVEQLSKWM